MTTDEKKSPLVAAMVMCVSMVTGKLCPSYKYLVDSVMAEFLSFMSSFVFVTEKSSKFSTWTGSDLS